MRIGVLTDIHGNAEALKVCLAHLESCGVDAYFFLGDYMGELPDVKETFEIIRSLQKEKECHIVKGNKEDYQLMGLGKGHPEWDEYKSVVGMLRYGSNQIDDEIEGFIEKLPIYEAIKYEGLPELLICHGSPLGTKRAVYSDGTVDREVMDCIEQDYIICGHTHVMANVDYNGRKIWNPGPVGVPIDGHTETQCMILNGEAGRWEAEFISLSYDYESVIEKMYSEGLFESAPYWNKITESLLRGGNVSHGTVLYRAMELCKQETGECIWPCISEEYMQRAYDELVLSKAAV